jgi:hypothetical protein
MRLPHLGVCGGHPTLEIAAPGELGNRSSGNLDRCRTVRELHVAYKLPYVYDYISKLCRTQAEVILNHVNSNLSGIGQGEARHRKCKKFKHGGGQAYDRSAD